MLHRSAARGLTRPDPSPTAPDRRKTTTLALAGPPTTSSPDRYWAGVPPAPPEGLRRPC